MADLTLYKDFTTVKIEYSGANPIYVGETTPGHASSEARWRIKKLTYDGDNVTDVQWAFSGTVGGSTEFKLIWDNRASYTYK